MGADVEEAALFFGILVAATGFDDHAAFGRGFRFHQEAVTGELDAVQFVGGHGARPDGFGDDAEHRAAVQFEAAPVEQGYGTTA